MKLTDEEIRRGYIGSTKEAVHPESFVEGARFAESHYLPMIEANEWRSMESAPKDGTSILLWENGEVTVGFWSTSIWVTRPESSLLGKAEGAWIIYENRSDTIELHPTHWMPTPKPPIDPEREAFEKWYATQKVVLPSLQDAAHKECCWRIWQAARSRK